MSFDIHKYNSNNMNKILKHNTRYRDEPLRDVKYANIDIDKTQSYLNYSLGEVRDDPRQYIKDRIKAIDEINPPKRIKKDRVLMLGFSIAVPEELVGTGKERTFFEEVYNWECKVFGKENIVSTDIHRDEIHDYYDKSEKRWRTSREHLHSAIIPVTEDENGLKVNAKEFMNRERMKVLHKSLDDYINGIFGVHAITHSVHKGMDTEDLKRESIETQAKMVGRLAEQERELTRLKQELVKNTVASSIDAAKNEIQRDLYKQQLDEMKRAIEELTTPEIYAAIKKKTNENIDKKYIELGENLIRK